MTVIKINAITVPADTGDELAHRFASRAGAVDNAAGFEGFELLVVPDRRRSVQLFLDDVILLVDLPSQNAGSAHILRESFPAPSVGAPRVRIPTTLHRSHSSPTVLAILLRANIHGIFRPSQMEARLKRASQRPDV